MSPPPVRLLDREAVRFIVPAWAAMQALVLLCIWLVVRAHLVERHPEPMSDFDRLFSPFMFMDGEHYIEIAMRGYRAQGREHLWAFFPLYPHLARWLGAIVGSVPLAGVLISQLAHLASLFYLRGLARMHGDENFARRAVVFCLAFPAGAYWHFFYTESVYFLLLTACFYHAFRSEYARAGIFGALAATARSPGLMLIPAFAFGLMNRSGWKLRFERRQAWLLLVALGATVPFGVGWLVAKNPMIIVSAQQYWARSSTFPLLTIAQAVQDIRVTPIDWTEGAAMQREVDVLAVGIAFYVAARATRVTDASLALFSLLCILLPLSSGLVSSIMRYTMVVPTVYIVLAKDLDRRSRIYPALALSLAIFVIAAETVVSGARINID